MFQILSARVFAVYAAKTLRLSKSKIPSNHCSCCVIDLFIRHYIAGFITEQHSANRRTEPENDFGRQFAQFLTDGDHIVRKTLKSLLTFIVSSCILFSLAPGLRAGAASYTPESGAALMNNPLFAAQSGAAVAAENPQFASDGVLTCSGMDGLIDIVRRQMLARSTSFSVKFTQPGIIPSVTQDFLDELMRRVCAADDPATSGDADYLSYNYSWAQIYYTGDSKFIFSLAYQTTAEEEAMVDQKIKQVLDALDVYESSQYEKICAVHSYIVGNVRYDDTLIKHSAFDALIDGSTVCQGYALLTYKMLTELNVPTHIITGTGNGGDHGWNIVKIRESWYNLDVTWDDSTRSKAYFLKGSSDFKDHIRAAEFTTQQFQALHPMSKTAFLPANDVILVYAITLDRSFAEMETGKSVTLSALVTPENASQPTLNWSSSNPAAASVLQDGTVRALSPGTAVITASAADGSGIQAACTVRVCAPPDFTKASAWARGELSALYERGIVPCSLLSRFSDGVTRAEFIALMVNVYEYSMGEYSPEGVSPFMDISGSPYRVHIEKAYALGLINGVSGTRFAPDSVLTREQCAKILCVTFAAIGGDALGFDGQLPYQDASQISGWAQPYVGYAYVHGLMAGDGSRFHPARPMTREQAMAVCQRALGKYNW